MNDETLLFERYLSEIALSDGYVCTTWTLGEIEDTEHTITVANVDVISNLLKPGDESFKQHLSHNIEKHQIFWKNNVYSDGSSITMYVIYNQNDSSRYEYLAFQIEYAFLQQPDKALEIIKTKGVKL